jgi:hypothetical protein
VIRFAPVYFTDDVPRTQAFLAALGFADSEAEHRNGGWVEVAMSDALLCLHLGGGSLGTPAGAASLSFESDEDPESIARRLVEAGFDDATVLDENYGRVVSVRNPDGQPMLINFSDRTLYT